MLCSHRHNFGHYSPQFTILVNCDKAWTHRRRHLRESGRTLGGPDTKEQMIKTVVAKPFFKNCRIVLAQL